MKKATYYIATYGILFHLVSVLFVSFYQVPFIDISIRLMVAGLFLAVSWGLTYAVKCIVRRERPQKGLFKAIDVYSFPSSHTSALTALSIFIMMYNPLLGLAAIIVALAVGVARAKAGVHYASDIIAGALFGIIVAYYICIPISAYFSQFILVHIA